MKKINLILTILTLLLTINCSSMGSKSGGANGISVEKKEGFNTSTKRVSTLNVYHLGTQKLGDKSDLILNTLGASIDGKISEIYGEGIVGGDAITNLAKKLKLKSFEASVKNLVDSQVNGVELTPDSKKTLSTITEKGKIDALAVPVVSDGFETLKTGGKVNIFVIIYDGKTSNIQIVGKREGLVAKPEDITLAETKPDQARANMNLSTLTASNELLDAMKKEIKGANKTDIESSKDENPTVAEEIAKDSPKEEKEPEALSGVDEWLVSKIKVGLGPLMMGFAGLLFLAL